jgi:L-asparaginase II
VAQPTSKPETDQTALLSHPLLTQKRGRHIENRFNGWFLTSTNMGDLHYASPGSSELNTYFRSSAKPFQAFPLLTAMQKHNITLPTQALAIACSSHSGTPDHTKWSAFLLEQAGLTQKDLQCGPHPPVDKAAAKALETQGISPTTLHNNCSGKHAGMLYACVLNGWPTENYLAPKHPLQQSIIACLEETAEEKLVDIAIDGCGAPVFYLPLKIMAKLYARLATEARFQHLIEAMTQFPELVGGQERIDTSIMQVSKGTLLAKVGADGVMCIANREKQQGFALKMENGQNSVRDQYLPFVLHQLGWLNSQQLQNPALENFLAGPILNTCQTLVGQNICHMPPNELLAPATVHLE